jgi:ElaB/YqjD/DUF883 family membrane-anchored ribosome-binding protein
VRDRKDREKKQGEMDGEALRGSRDASELDADAPGVARVVEQARRLRDDVEGLISAVVEARGELESQLRDRLSERPYVGLATAAGLGYVLGAGLSPALVRVALGVGTRVAFAVVVRRVAVPLTQMMVGRTS